MELQEYLTVIENCPDESLEDRKIDSDRYRLHVLSSRYGIYDNYSIFLGIGRKKVLEFLRKRKDFLEVEENNLFHYVPGVVELTLNDYKKDSEFPVYLILHLYQSQNIPGISREKALAEIVCKIGRWALEEKIPLTLPKAKGPNRDNSEIISYRPDLEGQK